MSEGDMTLDQLLEAVEGSRAEDWHVLAVDTIYRWEGGHEGGQNNLEPKLHDHLAIYRYDVGISLAFGATVNDEFAEDWVQEFPDSRARSAAVWLRYHGHLVFQWTCVVVDGGRYLLPLPDHADGRFWVSQAGMPIARLLFDLFGPKGPHQPLESALKIAGIDIY
jgi:hypothetical protein